MKLGKFWGQTPLMFFWQLHVFFQTSLCFASHKNKSVTLKALETRTINSWDHSPADAPKVLHTFHATQAIRRNATCKIGRWNLQTTRWHQQAWRAHLGRVPSPVWMSSADWYYHAWSSREKPWTASRLCLVDLLCHGTSQCNIRYNSCACNGNWIASKTEKQQLSWLGEGKRKAGEEQ